MESDKLKQKAIITWIKYGEVIIKVFSFPKRNLIESYPLENLLATSDKKKSKDLLHIWRSKQQS